MGDGKRWKLEGAYDERKNRVVTSVAGPSLPFGESHVVVDEAWCRADERRRVAEALRAEAGPSALGDFKNPRPTVLREAADIVESLPDLGGPD